MTFDSFSDWRETNFGGTYYFVEMYQDFPVYRVSNGRS